MDELLQMIQESFRHFSVTDVILLAVNGLLLLFSRPLLRHFAKASGEEAEDSRLHYFRAANSLMLLLVLFYNLLLPLSNHSWVTQGLASLLVTYLGYLSYHVVAYLLKRRFGRVRETSNGIQLAETYNSRVLSLISAVFLFVVVLIAIVRILGFDSLLEAGGVIGFIGVFLALTQSSWAPDVISGLIILNSRLMEEGDVIEFSDNRQIMGTVFKTKIFHTEILDLVNNHRIMMQNTRLRQLTLHNLSKFASAKGLREVLRFKIGYDVEAARVRELCDSAFQTAIQDADMPIEAQYPVEVRASEAGDFSVTWSVYYYTKDIKRLIGTRHNFLEVIVSEARQRGIALATPMQHILSSREQEPAVPASPEAAC